MGSCPDTDIDPLANFDLSLLINIYDLTVFFCEIIPFFKYRIREVCSPVESTDYCVLRRNFFPNR